MTPIADMIREMTSAGIDLDTILLAVEAVEKAVRPQNSADVSADRRRERDRLRKKIARENPQNSADSAEIPQTQENASISKDLKKRERQNRGTRLSPEWTLSEADRSFAKQEGFSDWEVQREAQKFRDYWTACAGSKGVKLDWPATWRQWIRNSADRSGKAPTFTANIGATAEFYYAAPDSEQLAAWDAFTKEKTGKGLPRDRNGGWHVKSEWPPKHSQQSEAAA